MFITFIMAKRRPPKNWPKNELFKIKKWRQIFVLICITAKTEYKVEGTWFYHICKAGGPKINFSRIKINFRKKKHEFWKFRQNMENFPPEGLRHGKNDLNLLIGPLSVLYEQKSKKWIGVLFSDLEHIVIWKAGFCRFSRFFGFPWP